MKKSILVVDDVEDISEALKHILQHEGFNVITASNGKKAVKVIEENQIDLIITDILMPEMDGMELVSKVKKLSPDTRFILMSAGGRQAEKEYDYLEVAKKLTGVNVALKKPFEPTELIALVGDMIAE